MKTKIYNTFTKPYIVVLVMFLAPLLNFFDRNFSYFFGLGIVLIILWSSRFNWSLFGFAKKITRKTIIKALLITACLIILDAFTYSFLEYFFGTPDYSSFESIKHNTIEAIIMLMVVWIFAAVGEEILFRGYYMKWLAQLFGNSSKGWLASGIITSLYFAISHYYQGITGVLGIIIWTLIISYIFYKNKQNLGLLVLIHGFHDTWGLTFLYLDIENPETQLFDYLLLG